MPTNAVASRRSSLTVGGDHTQGEAAAAKDPRRSGRQLEGRTLCVGTVHTKLAYQSWINQDRARTCQGGCRLLQSSVQVGRRLAEDDPLDNRREGSELSKWRGPRAVSFQSLHTPARQEYPSSSLPNELSSPAIARVTVDGTGRLPPAGDGSFRGRAGKASYGQGEPAQCIPGGVC